MTELRALVVEDSEDDAELVVRELERGGYRVKWTRVDSAGELNEALDRQAWDIVFSDFTLPNYSGASALEAVLRRGLDVPFIYVSGTIGEDRAVQAMKDGAHDYLLKDNLRRLVPAVQRELREAKGRLERRRTEKELAQSEARYRSLFDSTPAPMWVYDLETLQILAVNGAAIAQYGYSADEFIAMTIEQLRPPEDVARLQEHLAKGTPPGLHRAGAWHHRRKDGKVITVEISSHELVFEGRRAQLVVSNDITARARAEAAQAAVYQIAHASHVAADLEELYRSIHAIVGTLMPAKNLYIALHDPQADLITFPYFVDEVDTAPEPRKPGHGLTEYVLRTGQPLLATPDSEAVLKDRGVLQPVGASSVDWLGVPLHSGDRTIGVLAVQTYTPGVRYEEHHKEMLQFVSTQVAAAIERMRAEQELRASEARLVAILEAALDAHITIDQTGNVLGWNRQAETMFGWSRDEVRGKRLADLIVPAQYRNAHLAGLRRFLTTGEGRVLNQRLELTALRRDGHEFPVELAIAPIRVGSAWLFSAFLRDITARNAAAAALRSSEAHHRTVLEHIADAVFITDAEGRYLDVNPRACELTGYDRETLLRMSSPDTYPIDARAEARLRLSEIAAETRGGSRFFERQLVRKDGGVLTVEVTARPLPDGRLLATARDVTERRQLEQQLRQAQKMEAIGRLAGGVAHDFNNVLTAVFGYVDLLQEELPANSGAQADLAEVRKAAERAAALTRQLLAFSRQQVLESVVLHVNDLIEDFEKMLRRVIGEDVLLRLALSNDAGNVRADPGQLHQVIMNLVVNARDAMPTGGSLIIETANADLTEQYAELHQPVIPGRYVMVAVSDSGMGMSPEVKARIFEPFFTTKEKGRGTGLGLSTVYGIVKQSGGYIWAYSEVGRGTTFKIYLPRVDAPAEPLSKPRENGSVAGTETILLAEDDPILRPLAKALLEKVGYTVLEAEDAQSALAAARAHTGPIHLLVADVVMPGPSGRELARRLAEFRPDTKVLYVSGYTDDAIVHHGMLEPGLNFLQKPFTPAVLARKVREVLDIE